MRAILRKEQAHQIHKGDFNIDIHFPGLALSNHTEKRGLAQLGRFDHGNLLPGVFVGMHPHKNDEILSYIRSGALTHEDTSGERAVVSNKKLMMMNAGSGIYHQEQIPENGEAVNMLQIFLRPDKEDLEPTVQFSELDEAYSHNTWRLVAGPRNSNANLKVNSEVFLYDMQLQANHSAVASPIEEVIKEDKTYLIYVFSGAVLVNNEQLNAGDSYIYEQEKPTIEAIATSDLLLFELNKHMPYSRKGMYSGV